MNDTARARELVERADATVSDDTEAALTYLSEAAAILDAIDLEGAYDSSLVGRSVESYVTLAREKDADSEDQRQAIRAGIDRASQKLSLIV